MNFLITSHKNWARVALCAMAISSYAYSSSTVSIAVIKQIGSSVVKGEQILTQFFNEKSSISYNDCVISLEKMLIEYLNKVDNLIQNKNDALSKKAHDVGQEFYKHFNAAYSVIKQYNGKPASAAGKFKTDIERVFSLDSAFSAITTKLRSLYKDAEAANETELMHVVQQLMLVLEKKKAEWNNKSPLSLLFGLTARMG